MFSDVNSGVADINNEKIPGHPFHVALVTQLPSCFLGVLSELF